MINFVTELDPGMSAQSSRKRSTSPTSRELAARVEQLNIDTDDEYEEPEVVCALKFEEHAMTDDCNPHNEIQHEVSAPHLHQDPRIVTTLEDGSIDLEKHRVLWIEAIQTGDHTEVERFADNVPESSWSTLFGPNNEREPPEI